ncbi:MAG TPA: ABC transporter ATP-binding protein [Acidimicrobiales bacterium]|nr:ABC transporter ATP-binding protein [Acidimicrobiales bacterium]
MILEARGVTVRFGGLTALKEVSLAVPPGSIVGLVGPNGAGKTTLFGVLSGILLPDSGSVLLRDRDVTGSTPQVRARAGLARTFQRTELFSDLTVREHLVLAHHARHTRPRLWRDLVGIGPRGTPAEVEELLAVLGLEEVSDRPARSIPLGTGRLVEVGRALATDPVVILLDEPSSGLDVHETEQLAATLLTAREQRGVALVLVEHDLDLVLGMCDRVDVLDFGEMIASGPPEVIREDPTVRAAYIGDEALL